MLDKTRLIQVYSTCGVCFHGKEEHRDLKGECSFKGCACKEWMSMTEKEIKLAIRLFKRTKLERKALITMYGEQIGGLIFSQKAAIEVKEAEDAIERDKKRE